MSDDFWHCRCGTQYDSARTECPSCGTPRTEGPTTLTWGELRALAEQATPGPWYAVVNDLIGGWAVATVDKPCSAHNHEAGEGEVADFVHEADARFIAAVRTAFAYRAED